MAKIFGGIAFGAHLIYKNQFNSQFVKINYKIWERFENFASIL
jgi:hypothetical protein